MHHSHARWSQTRTWSLRPSLCAKKTQGIENSETLPRSCPHPALLSGGRSCAGTHRWGRLPGLVSDHPTCWGRACREAGWPVPTVVLWAPRDPHQSLQTCGTDEGGSAFLSWRSRQEAMKAAPRDHAGHGLGSGHPMTCSSRHGPVCRRLFFMQTTRPGVQGGKAWWEAGSPQGTGPRQDQEGCDSPTCRPRRS